MRKVENKCGFIFSYCRSAGCRGVTLVELIIAFALIVIVFAAVVPQFRAIRLSWAGAETAAEIIQNGRVLSEHITRHLSAAKQIISVSADSVTEGYIIFADANGDNYRYMYLGGYVVFGPQGSEEQLAGLVTRFQISCYLIDPTVTLTTDVNEIRLVEIETDFPNEDAMGTDKTFITSVYLRANTDDWCGIVGYWKLDETSGTTAADSSGQGNDGTLVNMSSPGCWTTGRINGALDFDGNNDRVNLPIDSVINSLEDCTVAAWVRWSGLGDYWQRVWDFGTGTTYNMFLTVNNSYTGTPRFAITVSGWSGEDTTTAPDVLTPNTWHHMAVTIDAENHTHNLYIDGDLVQQNTSAYLTPGDLGNTDKNYLARSNYSADDYFDGRIDDVRIYNRALDADEIIQLANSVNFRDFKEAKTPSDTISLTISTPNDVNEDDLLIAAVATDGDTSASLAPPGGEAWTEIDVDDYTSSSEIPSVTHESGRQCLIGFVVNAASSSDTVGVIGSWIDGTTHVEETGTNRALIFCAHAQTSRTLNTVRYGGQWMTKVVQQAGGSGSNETYVVAFILDEAGINAASSATFSPNWSSYPGTSVAYSSVFLQNVNQSALTGNSDGSTTSGTALTTSALAADKGDMVIEAAACSNTGTYTMNNAFTKDIDLSESGYDGGGGHKSAGGAVTLGAWWKLAASAESATHQFTWSGGRQAYGWIMRFTGHDEADPINIFSTGNDSDSAPTSPSVTTTADNCMILRLGAFDNGDIIVDDTGLPSGYTDITMDRSVPVLFEDGFETGFGSWNDNGTTDWEWDNNPVYSGGRSANADRYDSDLTSDNINTSSYSSFVVSFWYRDHHIDFGDGVCLRFYDGSSYDYIFNLGSSTEDRWNYYTITITDSQYCRSNFRIRFDAAGMNSSDEDLWIDDVVVYSGGGVSGGAGYIIQDTAGDSSTADFLLGWPNEARMITVAIKPGALCEEACCTETIKP